MFSFTRVASASARVTAVSRTSIACCSRSQLQHSRFSTIIATRPQLQYSIISQFSQTPITNKSYSTGRSAADEIAEELQSMYAEVKDEFEIATESTEAHATYAAEDREAARDELAKLTKRWQEILELGGEVTEELKKRPIGQRIRELAAAIEELNKKDFED